MNERAVERQIERSRQRLDNLRRRAEREGAGAPLTLAVEELGHTLEELSVTLEELASTNEELGEAQLAAEQHARRYQDLFRFAPDAYVVTDERGVIRELNAVAEQKLGRTGRYLTGKPLLPLVAKADRDAFLECLAALRARSGRLEERLLRFGSDPGFDASVTAVPDVRDGELEIRWMLRDVSARRKAEAALRESEARARLMADTLPLLICYVDREERYRFSNAAHSAFFGLPPEAILGRTVRELAGEEIYQAVRDRVARALAGEETTFQESLSWRSEVVDVSMVYAPHRDPEGRVLGFYSVATDVTGLRRMEREAQRAEGRTRALLDAALDGILSADERGVIRLVNPALCRMFGYEAEELVGRGAADLLGPSARRGHRRPFAAMVGSVRELEGVARDGVRFPIQVSVGQAQLEEGRSVVVSIRDLRGQRSLESQLRAAAAAATVAEDRERRRLAADLHDDVSQLLTLAGMKLGMLRGEADGRGLEKQVREVEELVTRAHQRTDSLTFQLSPPILHDVGLAAAAEWLAEEMERSYGLGVRLERNGEPPIAEEVRITLFRSLRELLINVARHARTERAWVRVGCEDSHARVEVRDEGVGFDPEIDRPGYGLLSIRERLRHLDGRLEIESVPGDGTRVTLTAPLVEGGRGEDPGL